MKRPLACLLGLAAFALPGCVSLYGDVKFPLDTDLQATRLGAKTGRASSHQVLGLVAWGDSGTQAAAANGQLTTINHADQEWFSLLWVGYVRQTTVVYGD